MKHNKRKNGLITLYIEIILTIAICCGMVFTSFIGLTAESGNLSSEVFADYQSLYADYIRAFKVLRMEAVNKIQEDLTFDEMQEWIQSKEDEYREAVGEDVYDGFAFTYKGGYVHSWNYGDYSDYDPASRPWYQAAEKADGEVAVVAPYVTFLSGTGYIDKYDILRMSVVQQYNDEVSFDFDLNVGEINALIAGRKTVYDETIAFLYDKDGYILSSTNSEYYGHNIHTADEQVSQKLCDTLQNQVLNNDGIIIRNVDGVIRLLYSITDEEGKTVCLLIPFFEVFKRNILFVLLLALVLIGIEILFYYKNKIQIEELEEKRKLLKEAFEQAEHASHAKGDFMSRMSHEIRTPLNAIIGYLEIAHDEPQDYEKVDNCIVKSQTASRHLLSIINDVLDISAIESGRMKIAHEDFDLKQLVSALTTVFYSQAKSKDVEFNVRVAPLEHEWFSGDELRIRQILLNLLSNAVKFTPAQGSVTLEIKQVGYQQDKTRIEFKVMDTGIGMSEEYRSRMFKPFEQEEATTARNYGGSGLGLSICYNLVRMMGGSIDVKSKQGEGSTFTVLLAFDAAKDKPEEVVPPDDFSHVKVLVVDDDADTCAYMEKLLSRMRITCETVTSGKKAIRRVINRKDNGHQYDLCIIDWCMKDMDGIETAREVRKLCGKDIPIIIATAYDYAAVADEAREIGVDKIVSKPLFQSTLFDLLVSTYGKYKPVDDKKKQQVKFTGTRLILAEDNEMNMEIALDILKKAGLEITPVVNGKEAVDTFVNSTPGTYDAILMDVQMPVMDGYTATRKIRESEHAQAKTIPIIAMTANAFSEDVTAALAAGMNDHVAKPISYQRLFDSLIRLTKKTD